MKIIKIEDYSRMFKDGKTASVAGLCGRVIRGRKAEDFLTLTDDPKRKLVMLMGPDGLEKLLGKSGYETLIEIGYDKDYIVRKVDEGNAFKLVVFREGGAAKLATWDNMIEIVAGVYRDIADRLYRNLDQMKTVSFDEIERLAGFDLSEVDKVGDSDSRYMTYERYKVSADTVVNARAFLYFTVHLRELFSGDGYTYTNAGVRGLQEYIVANKPIAELGESEVIDIEVKIPTARKGGNTMRKGWPSFFNPALIGTNVKPDFARAREEARKLKLSSASKQKDKHLLIGIDVEDDFGDNGRLPVKGAYGDVERLCNRIINGVLDEFYTDFIWTIDIHPPHAIHNDSWWLDEKGNAPVVRPYPVSMKLIDENKGVFKGSDGKNYKPRIMKAHTIKYAQYLVATKQGDIWVFADHCREGSDGINIIPALAEVIEWASVARDIQPMFMYKGMIAEVDWFGPFRPCMDVPSHPQGGLQTAYLDKIAECKSTEITGEALDFCVKAGTEQVKEYYGTKPQILSTISFIVDTTSAIFPDNPANQAFLDDTEAKGIKLIKHDAPFVR